MERLTTNKPVSEMGMLELAHNCCYVKDRNARYRDFEMDMDARELTRQLLKDHAQDNDAFESDEDFDEWMVDYLQNGIDTKEGLIALFYRNLWAMAELREQLQAYEDAEEQGLLVKVECHCKDCVHWSDMVAGATEHVKLCSIGGYMVGKNGYCVYAEQKLAEMKGE